MHLLDRRDFDAKDGDIGLGTACVRTNGGRDVNPARSSVLAHRVGKMFTTIEPFRIQI